LRFFNSSASSSSSEKEEEEEEEELHCTELDLALVFTRVGGVGLCKTVKDNSASPSLSDFSGFKFTTVLVAWEVVVEEEGLKTKTSPSSSSSLLAVLCNASEIKGSKFFHRSRMTDFALAGFPRDDSNALSHLTELRN
jgi:hypothetical protein